MDKQRPLLEISKDIDIFFLEQLAYKKIRQELGACSAKKFAYLCTKPPSNFSTVVTNARTFIDIVIT